MNKLEIKKNWMAYALSLIFVSIPLFFINSFYNSFELPKSLLFRTEIFLVIIGLIIQFIKTKEFNLHFKRLIHPIFVFFTGLFVTYYFSMIIAGNTIYSFYGSYFRQLGFLQWIYFYILLVLMILFLDKKTIKYLLIGTILSAIIMSIYGLMQMVGYDVFFSSYDKSNLSSRIFGFLSHPNFLAQFLGPIIPISIASCFIWKNKIIKFIAIFCSILFYFVTLLTLSRATILAVHLTGFIFAIWIFFKSKINVYKKIIIIISILFLTFTGYLVAKNRINLTEENLRSLKSRIEMWEIAYKNWKDNPILGTGLESYELYFPKYADKEFFYYEQGLNFTPDRPHNEFFETLTFGGILGIFFYLGLLIIATKVVFLMKRSPLLYGVYFAYLIYFIQNQFSFSLISHFLVFLLILSTIIIFSEKEDKTMKIDVKFHIISKCIIAIFVIVLVIFGFRNTVLNPLYAESNFSKYINAPREDLVQKVIKYNPYNTYYRYMALKDGYGTLNDLKNICKIEGSTIKSLDWEATSISKTNLKEAKRIFDQIIFINPYYAQSFLDYANILYENKEYGLAAIYYEKFLENIPEFWEWSVDLNKKSSYQVKQYEIFFRNSPNFTEVFKKLSDSYIKINQQEKAKKIELFMTINF